GSGILQLPNGTALELTGAGCFDAPLHVHARQGGERILLPRRAHRHSLRKLFQAEDVPPWRRIGMPLLSDANGVLHAAGDCILSAWLDEWLQAHDAHLVWHEDPVPCVRDCS
ncbi:MAG: tRNA lysidine(34) synthetase TilS, partial [Pseudomonadota bacterium]|nr:tRNA lysidine(34) synthetase TilS [Pseudomonadota bacterium]